MKNSRLKIILIVSCFISISSCSSVENDWRRAKNDNTSSALIVFLQMHPDSRYANEAKARMEKFDWDQAHESNNLQLFRGFLQKYPNSRYASEAKARIVEIEWKWTQAHNNLRSLREFLRNHPDSLYATQAQSEISILAKEAWKEVEKEDKAFLYDIFIRDFPDSKFYEKAKERLDWQKANRAIVKIDYPKTVEIDSPSMWGENLRRWETVFSETGGKTGYGVMSKNFYILDENGNRWSNNKWNREGGSHKHDVIEVKPGGSAKFEYSFYDNEGIFSGGEYYATWIVEDDWGNQISIVQRIRIR